MACLSSCLPRTTPNWPSAQASGESPRACRSSFEPLKNVQVWRFSLYYFFVFGAFVALALWLPHYLIGVYGVDIKVAGMAAAPSQPPGQPVPRLWRASVGPLSARGGHVLDLRRVDALPVHAVLSADGLHIHGIKGPIAFSTSMGLVALRHHGVRARLLHELGKAAVFKHIPVYYPDHVGAVGGLVGMIGGLGGFVLPIAFGALLT
jgi:NNP family nitrate/nitrite transporter-like MFS transporter